MDYARLYEKLCSRGQNRPKPLQFKRPDISLRMKAFVRTPESNAKRSATQTGRKADPAAVAKRRAGVLADIARKRALGLIRKGRVWVTP